MASGPPFPYSFGDRIDMDDSVWALHNGTKKVRLSLLPRTHELLADLSRAVFRRMDPTVASSRLTLPRIAPASPWLRTPYERCAPCAIRVSSRSLTRSRFVVLHTCTRTIFGHTLTMPCLDRILHLHCHRAHRPAPLARATQEPEPGDNQMGPPWHCCTQRPIQIYHTTRRYLLTPQCAE